MPAPISPGKFGSASIWFLVDGYNLIANKLKGLRYKHEALQERSDGLGDTWEETSPTGMSRAELAQEGAFFDTTTNRIHTAMSSQAPLSPSATARVVCLGFAGHRHGHPFVGFEGAFSTVYEVLAQNAQLTKANAEYRISGQLDNGAILQPLATKDNDWNTATEGKSVDYAADSTQRVIPITSHTAAAAAVVTTPVPHGLTTGDIVVISSVHSAGATINGQRTVTVVSTTTFSVPVDTTSGAGTGGSFVRANSSGGGVGYLQVTAMTGFGQFVGKIRDSADDVTYADLITFTAVTSAPDAERKTVTGTVDRYLAFDGEVYGDLSASASLSPSVSASASTSPSASVSPSVSADWTSWRVRSFRISFQAGKVAS